MLQKLVADMETHVHCSRAAAACDALVTFAGCAAPWPAIRSLKHHMQQQPCCNAHVSPCQLLISAAFWESCVLSLVEIDLICTRQVPVLCGPASS